MKRETILVLSGGIDSVTMAHMLVNAGNNCRAVYLDYGKSISQRELAAAKHFSYHLDIPLEIIDAHGMTKLQLGYLPWTRILADEADIKDFEISTSKLSKEQEERLSKYPVVSSNWSRVTGIHHLISVASYFAQITNATQIALGLTKEQFVAFPGLKLALEKWCELLELLNPEKGSFKVLTPLIDMTKSEIIKLALDLEIPIEATWSCFYSTDYHCGKCTRCNERKSAFKTLGIDDPTEYGA
ncbi:hypothetical protein DBR28_12665 [Chryseobacterium sp. HMWF028]|nr:hypothetical protein DBR28_12665 [Chryseobacterium sp. HMWF028]